jgi:hypothetical protein
MSAASGRGCRPRSNGPDPPIHRGAREHRLRNQAVAIGPAILIVLAKNVVVLGDQQASDGIARQIVQYGRAIAPIVIANVRLRPLEKPWCGGALDPMRRIDLIKMAVSADAILQFMRLAGLNGERVIGNRKPLRGTVKLGVRTRGRETGPAAFSAVAAPAAGSAKAETLAAVAARSTRAARRETMPRRLLAIRSLLGLPRPARNARLKYLLFNSDGCQVFGPNSVIHGRTSQRPFALAPGKGSSGK